MHCLHKMTCSCTAMLVALAHPARIPSVTEHSLRSTHRGETDSPSPTTQSIASFLSSQTDPRVPTQRSSSRLPRFTPNSPHHRLDSSRCLFSPPPMFPAAVAPTPGQRSPGTGTPTAQSAARHKRRANPIFCACWLAACGRRGCVTSIETRKKVACACGIGIVEPGLAWQLARTYCRPTPSRSRLTPCHDAPSRRSLRIRVRRHQPKADIWPDMDSVLYSGVRHSGPAEPIGRARAPIAGVPAQAAESRSESFELPR